MEYNILCCSFKGWMVSSSWKSLKQVEALYSPVWMGFHGLPFPTCLVSFFPSNWVTASVTTSFSIGHEWHGYPTGTACKDCNDNKTPLKQLSNTLAWTWAMLTMLTCSIGFSLPMQLTAAYLPWPATSSRFRILIILILRDLSTGKT